MDEVEIIVPDEISESFLQSRRESAEKRDSDENQENIKKTQIKFKKRLVQKVRQQRALYDTNFKGFSNTDAKEKAWQLIAKELGREVDECKNSWVDLRYLYQKHVRKLRKFFGSGNKNRKQRPVMAFERELIFLWKYIADRSRLSKPRPRKPPTPTIECDEDDVVLLDDEEPVIIIDIDDNDSPTKTQPEFKSQSKAGLLQISPEVCRFVEALQEYPELYDYDNRYFADYRRKGIIWNALANELKDKATKLMKLWIYLQTRYEWEINHSTISEEETELKKLLSFLKPNILKNPNTVYKQCFYTKMDWQEPIEHFKNIFQLLVVIRKYPNIVNYTDDYLLSAKKDNDYLSSWVDISKTRGAAPGQCEITWLIMRFFYWELMHMRQHTYQLQDKWYFEGIISELYLHAKPLLDQQTAAEPDPEELDIYANSYATSSPIPIDLEANIDATCIYNNPENAHYKTFTENSTPMFPKITSAKSLHVSAQTTFGVQEKRTAYNSIPGVPATIKPVFPHGISLVPTSATSNIRLPTMTPITKKHMPLPLNKETTISLKSKPKSFTPKSVFRQNLIAPKPLVTTSLPMPPLQPLSSSAPTILKTVPALPAVASLPMVPSLPSVPSLPVVPSLSVVPSFPEVPSLPAIHPFPSESSFPSVHPLSSVSSLPSVSLLPSVPSLSVVPSISTHPSPPSIPAFPSPPSIPAFPSPPSISELSLPLVPSLPTLPSLPSPVPLSSPQPQSPEPSSNNLAPLPKITGALSLLNPNEIMIELVATPNGNQLLVHGPPLSEKYSLSMPTTAKFIREVMAIPRLHNKMIHPSGTNLYWQYLSKKFSLPIHICKACWNFLADNFTHFNQIAPMEELMKPFKTWFKVWKESTVLFRNFEALAVERGWLKYQNELPILMNEISNYQDIFEIVSSHKEPFPVHIRSMFSHIPDIWDICNAFKNVFVAYMSELERGVDNKWPLTWWRVLMKLKFLLEKRYKDTEPFYYIIRNKINEEIIRCAQKESNSKTENQLSTVKSTCDVKTDLRAELIRKLSKKSSAAPGSSQKDVDPCTLDPYKLMVCIRQHSKIYTNCSEWQKLEAWKEVAKKMDSTDKDCRLVFIRSVKDYRNFVQRDPNNRCRINQKYFKPLKDIYQSLQSTKKINIKTPSELNLSVDNSSSQEESGNVIPDLYIGDINMENAKPALVLKNWAYAIEHINNYSQTTTSLDGHLQSLFDKYRNYCV